MYFHFFFFGKEYNHWFRPKPDIIGWGETKTTTSWRKSYAIKPWMPKALSTIFTPFQCDGLLATTCRLYEISLLHNSGTWTPRSPDCITFQLKAASPFMQFHKESSTSILMPNIIPVSGRTHIDAYWIFSQLYVPYGDSKGKMGWKTSTSHSKLFIPYNTYSLYTMNQPCADSMKINIPCISSFSQQKLG